jgi:hypothetical protein
MAGIVITADFDAYPDGVAKRSFKVGETPADLPEGFADLLVSKGLAEKVKSGAKAKGKELGD